MRTPFFLIGGYTPYPCGQTPNEKYLANALERQGLKVTRIPRHKIRLPATPRGSFAMIAGPQGCDQIPQLRRLGYRVIFWTLDAVDAFGRRPGWTKIANQCETVFASADWNLKGYSTTLPFMRIPAAVADEPAEFKPNPKRPVAFLGGLYSDRRKQIAKLVKKLGGEVRSGNDERIFGRDLERYVQETKVMIGDNWTNSHEGYWSSRNYLLPGHGAFLLTANVPGLDKEFEPGVHLETWDTLEDLEKKTRYFIEHSEPREKIRKFGFHFTRKLHTWDARAKRLIQGLEVLIA